MTWKLWTHPRNVSREFLPCYATATVLSFSYEFSGTNSMESQRFRWTSLYDITMRGSLVHRANARKMPHRERKRKRKRKKEREREAYNFSNVPRNRDHRFPMTLTRRRDFLIKSIASSRLKYVLCAWRKKMNKNRRKKKEVDLVRWWLVGRPKIKQKFVSRNKIRSRLSDLQHCVASRRKREADMKKLYCACVEKSMTHFFIKVITERVAICNVLDNMCYVSVD